MPTQHLQNHPILPILPAAASSRAAPPSHASPSHMPAPRRAGLSRTSKYQPTRITMLIISENLVFGWPTAKVFDGLGRRLSELPCGFSWIYEFWNHVQVPETSVGKNETKLLQACPNQITICLKATKNESPNQGEKLEFSAFACDCFSNTNKTRFFYFFEKSKTPAYLLFFHPNQYTF